MYRNVNTSDVYIYLGSEGGKAVRFAVFVRLELLNIQLTTRKSPRPFKMASSRIWARLRAAAANQLILFKLTIYLQWQSEAGEFRCQRWAAPAVLLRVSGSFLMPPRSQSRSVTRRSKNQHLTSYIWKHEIIYLVLSTFLRIKPDYCLQFDRNVLFMPETPSKIQEINAKSGWKW